MKSIQQLRELHNAKALEMKNLVENTDDWGDEHQKKYDALDKEISDVKNHIAAFEKSLEEAAEHMTNVENRAAALGVSSDEAESDLKKEKDITNAWIRGGDNALSNEQTQWIYNRARTIQNALSVGTPSEGGYLVPSPLSSQILQAMKAFGGMRDVATIQQTSDGAPMSYPTSDLTGERGELVPENSSASDEDSSFGVKSLNVYKFSSKVITVPFELLQDSEFDVEAFIVQALANRLARSTNEYQTIGTGTNQPTGLITAATQGVLAATGQSTTVTTDSLLDLVHSVDPAYRQNAQFMFHDQTLKELKKLKDPSTSKPIWLAGYDVKEPDSLMGHSYVINQDVPQMAAGARSVAFGDMSKYVIRDVMAMLLFRMTDSVYTKAGQVGFLAWMRSGGNLMDVGGAVKYLQNSAS